MSGNEGGAVLITGATGRVGGAVFAELLETTERKLYPLIRAASLGRAEARVQDKMWELYGNGRANADRYEVVVGDVTLPSLGLSGRSIDQVAEEVDVVIHAAAADPSDLSLHKAWEVNVRGTEQVLTFAKACNRRGGLAVFGNVSPASVAGMEGDVFTEADPPGARPRNAFEQTQGQAERLCSDVDLPVQVYRRPIVVGETCGWTTKFDTVYPYVEDILYRHLEEIPADPVARLDLVPSDYLASSIVKACRLGEPGTYHLTSYTDAPTVEEFVRALNDLIGSSARVVPPREREALRAVPPFFVQGPLFSNEQTVRRLGEAPPRWSRYLGRLVEYAIRAGFGARRRTRVWARNSWKWIA